MYPDSPFDPPSTPSPFDDLPSVVSDFGKEQAEAVVLLSEKSESQIIFSSHDNISLPQNLLNEEGHFSMRNFEDKLPENEKEQTHAELEIDRTGDDSQQNGFQSVSDHSQVLGWLEERSRLLQETIRSLKSKKTMTFQTLSILYLQYETQIKVEQGLNYKTGPGRQRKNQRLPCQNLRQLIKVYFRDSIVKLVSNSKCFSRPDMIVTGFFRIIKKLPLVLVKRCGSGTQYKNNSLKKHLAAYVEAYTSFHFSTLANGEITQSENYNTEEWIASALHEFAHFIIIYFPKTRYLSIIKALAAESCKRQRVKFENILTQVNRSSSTKRNIRKWCQTSSVLRGFVELALEVLEEDNFKACPKASKLNTL